VKKKQSPINLTGFGFALVLTIIMEITARLGWLTSYVPPPSVIFVALWHGLLDGDISSQIGITCRCTRAGWGSRPRRRS
jgi:ABC-type nitrate/sulfonate/bicarbonate transport system permease component